MIRYLNNKVCAMNTVTHYVTRCYYNIRVYSIIEYNSYYYNSIIGI